MFVFFLMVSVTLPHLDTCRHLVTVFLSSLSMATVVKVGHCIELLNRVARSRSSCQNTVIFCSLSDLIR